MSLRQLFGFGETSRDLVLAELQEVWDQEDPLRPDLQSGPRHGDRTIDLTGRDQWTQFAWWQFLRAQQEREKRRRG